MTRPAPPTKPLAQRSRGELIRTIRTLRVKSRGQKENRTGESSAPRAPRGGTSSPTVTAPANDYASTYATNSAPGNVQAAQQLASLTGPYVQSLNTNNGSETNTLADSYKQATEYLGPSQTATIGNTAQNSANQTQGTDSMETMSQGFGGMPTMIQQFYNPKSSRGSRLGRGTDLASTMVQYGSAGGGSGPNITVSPIFSDIGNPFVSAGGGNIEVGDIALGGPIRQTPAGGGGSGGGGVRPGGGGGGGGGGGVRPGGGGGVRPGGGGGREGGGREGGGREEVGTTLNVSRALREAMKEGQSRNPRVTRSELKSIYKESGLGAEGFRDFLFDGEVKQTKKTPLGDKAYDFLNRQLGKVGAKPIPEVEVIRTPDPRKAEPSKRDLQNKGVIGLINLAGKPGTTNLKNFPQQQTGSNKKSDAKKRAEAKSSKRKK